MKASKRTPAELRKYLSSFENLGPGEHTYYGGHKYLGRDSQRLGQNLSQGSV